MGMDAPWWSIQDEAWVREGNVASVVGGEWKVAHRLDRDTSGVLLLARGSMCGELMKLFETGRVEKEYLLLVEGVFPDGEKNVVTGHRRRLSHRTKVEGNLSRIGSRREGGVLEVGGMFEVFDVESEYAKLYKFRIAETKFERCGVYKCRSSLMREQRYTVVRAVPKTGRTHQLRLHMGYLGFKLVGDIKYGAPLVTASGHIADHHFLHNHRIAFPHPRNKKILVEIQAPIPDWIEKLDLEPVET